MCCTNILGPATNFSELLLVPRKEILPLIGPLVRAGFSLSLCLNFLLLVSILSGCKHWLCVRAKSLQSCLTLCDPVDYSPPGSSVYGILQARILERVAMLPSRGSSQPRDQTRISHVSCIGRWVLCHWRHLGGSSISWEHGGHHPEMVIF